MTTRTRPPGPSRAVACLRFVLWFSGEFVRANVVVLAEVLTPGHTVRPAVVRVRLRARSELEIATLMSLICLTPGTLALDLSTGHGPPELTVHGMHADDPDTLRVAVAEMEDRLLACLRRPTPATRPEEDR